MSSRFSFLSSFSWTVRVFLYNSGQVRSVAGNSFWTVSATVTIPLFNLPHNKSLAIKQLLVISHIINMAVDYKVMPSSSQCPCILYLPVWPCVSTVGGRSTQYLGQVRVRHLSGHSQGAVSKIRMFDNLTWISIVITYQYGFTKES